MGASARSKKALQGGAHRYVDMWAFPGVHPTNIEFLQRLKMADDRQFTANTDVCGTVMEKDIQTGRWLPTHLVTIRTDAWKPQPETQQKKLELLQQDRMEFLRRQIKQNGALSTAQTERLHKQMMADPVMKLRPDQLEGRRLVMKLFRSNERVRWVGSLEEMTTREVHNSLASNRPLLSMSASLEGHKYLTDLEENYRTFRIPSIFSFSYFHLKKERMWYVNIKRKWISVGADFVIEAEGRKIGDIDGALFGLGYNAHVYVYEPELAKETQFLDLLTMFTTSVSYHASMRRAVRRRLVASRKGLTAGQIVEAEEFSLLKNPRAA
ncbi:hypothetical protein SH661x_002108 [Planctomicrobium sp. SH661]|uniref:hypothetical protein n=1 Tax=Planctomicrobium sp. SH661 TaxID=3448124 RepID=UPI003F5CA028